MKKADIVNFVLKNFEKDKNEFWAMKMPDAEETELWKNLDDKQKLPFENFILLAQSEQRNRERAVVSYTLEFVGAILGHSKNSHNIFFD